MRTLLTSAALLLLAGCHRGVSSDAGADREPATQSSAAVAKVPVGSRPGQVGQGTPLVAEPGHELAAFAAGCFWGVEDAFRRVPGVTATAVGYTGGHTTNPTYQQVCEKDTGHAETVLIEFDPKRVSYARLLDVFFQIHDPTTRDRQGWDVGDQYRSAIFTGSAEQAQAARAALVRAQPHQDDKIVTQVSPLPAFYRAEDYHQQYAERTGTHGCPVKSFSPESASL